MLSARIGVVPGSPDALCIHATSVSASHLCPAVTSCNITVVSVIAVCVANFAAADLDGLVRLVKRKLKKIQYRPHLIDGCLAATGLTIEPLVTTCTTSSTGYRAG